MERIALVTGGNRGIGKEICRQLAENNAMHIFLGSRNLSAGKEAQEELGKTNIEAIELDISSADSVARAFRAISENHGRLDVLVNNAGVFLDSMEGDSGSALAIHPSILEQTFRINTVGPYRTIQTFLPLMISNNYGRIVNLSSGMGQLSEMNGGTPGYRVSKTALNAVTKIFADETADKNILVNSVCPGWVKTDMGGASAERPVEKGAETPVWLATLPDDGPTGGFFRDKEPIDW